MPKLAKDRLCTGCLACKDICPQNAISTVTRNGQIHVAIDKSSCINCNLCERTCPIVSPISRNEVSNMRVYGGWATDEETRIDAASGGAFSGIAQGFFALHKGENIAVVGASLENNHVYHRIVESESDIFRLINSKYIQSNTDGIYKEVGYKLSNGHHVLFSGCPCQIAGLYAFLNRRRINKDRLITIELICHGIASQEALDLHLEDYSSSRIYRFRDKRNGTQDWKYSQCTTIDIDGKEIKLKRENDTFYAIYSSWLLNRKSCSNCKFAKINRIADITIADFWGLQVPDYYKQGVSLIVTNNEKGNSLIKKCNSIYTFEASLKPVINSNSNLFCGYKFIQFHPMVMFSDFFKMILPRKMRLNILKNRMPYKLFWAFYKLATIIIINIERKHLLAQLRNNEKLSFLLKDINTGEE